MMRVAAKVAPTQEVLGKPFDDVEMAVAFAQTAQLALLAGLDEDARAVARVVSDLGVKLEAIKSTLHDLVEWVA